VLTHQIDGQGEPVLLLNGGLMTIAAWEPIALKLAERFQVVRCDFHGQLLTPGEPEPSLDAHVRDVVELLDALALPRVHLVGTSFGALVALLVAARHPEWAASVTSIAGTDRILPEVWGSSAELREICLDSAAGGDGGRVLEFLLPTTYSPEYLEAQKTALAFHRAWVAALPAVWFRGLAAILSSLKDIDLTPSLGAVRCPALIVSAELDRMFPPERSRALAAAIPGARLELVPGAPHGMVVEQAGATARILLDFLDSIRTGASHA
jgi:pimeloyl-ACP methyl ester carboxylesterase